MKAIIFDCFGVLVGSGLDILYEKHFKNNPELIKQAEASMHRSNKGEITYRQYVDEVAKLVDIPAKAVEDELNQSPKNTALLAYIKNDLKPHYKIGFLSNAAEDWLDDLFSPEEQALFDAMVLSYQTGYAKPEAVIYEIMADKLGVRLNECVFIDDRQDYVDGALGVGMSALQYVDMVTLKNELTAILNKD